MPPKKPKRLSLGVFASCCCLCESDPRRSRREKTRGHPETPADFANASREKPQAAPERSMTVICLCERNSSETSPEPSRIAALMLSCECVPGDSRGRLEHLCQLAVGTRTEHRVMSSNRLREIEMIPLSHPSKERKLPVDTQLHPFLW